MTPQQVLIHLNLLDGVGPVTIAHIIAQCTQRACAFEEIYRFTSADWRSWGFSEHVAHLLVDGLVARCKYDEELERVSRHRVGITTLLDDTYPVLLRHCFATPPVLYWLGRPPHAQSYLAIIGSRAGTHYAHTFIEHIMPELVAADVAIVSGGAVGVDTMAHAAACAHSVPTIAVLGSGLLRPYPMVNLELFKKIVDSGGALVSPFSMQTVPIKGNFPARNRIIAGLSSGVLVVQAACKSGTHTTVQFALDYGRTVMAVPGAYHDELSVGCNALISQGAHVVVSAADIFQALGLVCTRCEKKIHNLGNSSVKTPQTLSEKILQLCVRARSFDELVVDTASDQNVVRAKLFELQINGLITQNFAGLFQVNS